ncbi:MAG TPA: hypothetical protein DCS83_07835 [Prevotella sp.]|nr:hypothetical protein [Prevotella sp.]
MSFSVKKISGTKKVYDIQVKNRHTFTVGKSKTVVHNCFLTYVPDSLDGLIDHSSETRWLSVLGGGVGGHWSDVRAVSDKAPGPIPFLHTVDADMEAYKQGKVRRGSYAAYMDVSHPDILEFINIRVPTGDASRKCHSAGFHHGVNITDDFMEAVSRDGMWELKDPNDNSVRETVAARKLWEQILEIRYRTGEPYLYFIDAAKRAFPKTQTALGLTTHGSNLCVVGDTMIDIKVDGDEKRIRMDEFVEKYQFGLYSDALVKSYDTDKGEYTWSSVSAAAQTGVSDELIRIETEDGKVLECTEDHQIFTKNRGWVKAGELVETDELVIS